MRKIISFFLLITLCPCLLFSQQDAEAYDRLFATNTGIAARIQAKLEQLALDPGCKIGGEKYHNIEYITNLYQQNNYQPFWTQYLFAQVAVGCIEMSNKDGLIPMDYHIEAIQGLLGEVSARPDITPEKISKAAELELLLTDGIIFYANHLLYGKCDPVSFIPTFNFGFAPIPDLNPTDFQETIMNGTIMSRLDQLRPKLPLYDTLMSKLDYYRGIETKGGWPVITAGGKIKPGDKDSRIPQIRKRLMVTGDLSSDDSAAAELYDEHLEKDIKRFQASHGLDPDGIIGAGTFRELSVPVSKRIETIRINMERARWVSRNLPENYLIVNIAGFWLILVKEDQVVHTARVVVGKPLNKTPVFRDRIRYIDFNPTWTVPRSIIKNEIIPKLKKDSLYLQKQKMVLLDSKGTEVPISDIDISSLSANKFPYLVRQQPGPDNALGVVKFMFPNDYDIYLHDTPSKSLFSKASRAYSHGCIRVDKPLDLAVKLLDGTEWTREKIDATIKTRETTRVLLPEPMEILIMYWTCGLNPQKQFFFAPDIYSRDPEVLKQLDQLMQ
jgi:murein L,D-transpeptidase YcbB/YkuD